MAEGWPMPTPRSGRAVATPGPRRLRGQSRNRIFRRCQSGRPGGSRVPSDRRGPYRPVERFGVGIALDREGGGAELAGGGDRVPPQAGAAARPLPVSQQVAGEQPTTRRERSNHAVEIG
jgi:hypothetical protein